MTPEQPGVDPDLGAGPPLRALWPALAILAPFALRWALARAARAAVAAAYPEVGPPGPGG